MSTSTFFSALVYYSVALALTGVAIYTMLSGLGDFSAILDGAVYMGASGGAWAIAHHISEGDK